MEEVSSYIEGPRWADLENPIRKVAVNLQIQCSVETVKGLLRKTVYYTLKGERKQILSFKEWISKFVVKYNTGCSF